MISSLTDLLHPHDPALLLRAAAKEERLFLRTERAASFATLLSWERLNEVITADKVLAGEIEFWRNDTILPAEMTIVRPGRQKAPIRMRSAALEQYARQGVSTVVNAVQYEVPDIQRLNAIIEREFRAPVQTNVYASFGRDSAFKPHWDSHNVLVLQLSGRKLWRSWGQPWRAPLSRSECKVPENPGPAEWEMMMEPGDVLYLPRGEIHAARLVDGEDSLHLTVGIAPPKIEALAAALVEACQEEDLGRQDLPILANAADQSAWMEAAKALLHQAVEKLNLEEILARLDRREEALPCGFFGLDRRLTPQTLISPTLRRRLTQASDALSVCAGTQSWTVTGLEGRILDDLLRQHTRTLETLSAFFKDKGEEAVRDAVRSLARKGLVNLRNG
jgi:hypothetical protein